MSDKLVLELSVTDNGTPVITKFAMDSKTALDGATESSNKMGASLGALKDSAALMAAGMGGALQVFNQISGYASQIADLAAQGAKVEMMTTAFGQVAAASGLMGAEVVKNLQDIGNGMVNQSDIMQKAGRMIQNNMPIDTINELMGLLAKEAPLVGDTLSQAWDKFGEALDRGNTRSLREYTGLIDVNAVYIAYADNLGINVSRLTDQAKQAALTEAVLAKLRETSVGAWGYDPKLFGAIAGDDDDVKRSVRRGK